ARRARRPACTRRLRHGDLGNDQGTDRARGGATRDFGDLRGAAEHRLPARKNDAPAARRHRRGAVRAGCPAYLDGLELALVVAHAVALVPERLLLRLEA